MKALNNWRKERDEALFSLDRDKIERYLKKYSVPCPDDANDIVFWAGIYKAICNIKYAPENVVQVAKEWLAAHNMREQIRL